MIFNRKQSYRWSFFTTHEFYYTYDMRYMLNYRYSFRGYADLPFGLYDEHTSEMYSFRRSQYSLLLDCDGKTDIMLESLSPEDRDFFKKAYDFGFIKAAKEAEHLTDHQRYIKYDNAYKKTVHLSITGNCNCKCRHCLMSAPHAKYDQMSVDDIKKILDDLRACGITRVQITGGEPLMHPDFETIVEEIGNHGLRLETIYTNGILFSEDTIDLFKRYNLTPSVRIPFDGLGYHDWMRGIDGAQDAAIKAIRLCVAHDIPCHATMTLFKDNLGSIKKTVGYLEELGVKTLKIARVEDLGEWHAYSVSHGISREEAWDAFIRYIPVFLSERHSISLALEGLFSYNGMTGKITADFEKNCHESTLGRYLLCASLKDAFFINSNGNVLPCMSYVGSCFEGSFGNILETPLKEILDVSSPLVSLGNSKAGDFLGVSEKCRDCEYRLSCIGGCRAKPIIAGGKDLMAIDEETCAYYLHGYKKRKDEILRSLNLTGLDS